MSDIRVRQLCWMVLYSSYIIVPTSLIEFNDSIPSPQVLYNFVPLNYFGGLLCILWETFYSYDMLLG